MLCLYLSHQLLFEIQSSNKKIKYQIQFHINFSAGTDLVYFIFHTITVFNQNKHITTDDVFIFENSDRKIQWILIKFKISTNFIAVFLKIRLDRYFLEIFIDRIDAFSIQVSFFIKKYSF